MVKHSQNFQYSKFSMYLQYLKKQGRDEVDFFHTDKHQSFVQVDFNTFGIRISYKVILSLFIGRNKHSQSTLRNKFIISLQSQNRNQRWSSCRHQSFQTLALSFLMKVTRHVQSTRKIKLVIFLQYLKKKKYCQSLFFAYRQI